MKRTKILSLNSVPPICNYSIRAAVPNGPLIQSAKLNDSVYHRWECEDDHRMFRLFYSINYEIF